MDSTEDAIRQSYSRGQMLREFHSAIKRMGKERVTQEDLASADAFHIGGRRATRELAASLAISPEMKILDIGCGIGGTARFLAAEYGCFVTGIDLLEEFVELARDLSERTGLSHLNLFLQGNALALPFNRESFDLVWSEHAQMNLPDKKLFFSEVSRVLKKEGRFVFYEIFGRNNEGIPFPMPWASSARESFLISPENNEILLQEAGLRLSACSDLTSFAPAAIKQLLDRISARSMPPLHLGLLMGEGMEKKLSNLLQGIEKGQLLLLSAVAEKLKSPNQ